MALRAEQIPPWQEIAAFYAGRPINRLEFRDMPGLGTTGLPESGDIFMNRQAEKSLGDFLRYRNDRARGPVMGVLGLATLIHEAIHNRKMEKVFGKPASDEIQAGALGTELIPDLLQRFFGIPIGSPLSRRYEKAAKGLSSYPFRT